MRRELSGTLPHGYLIYTSASPFPHVRHISSITCYAVLEQAVPSESGSYFRLRSWKMCGVKENYYCTAVFIVKSLPI